jgi:hypothetical protein
MGAQAGKDVLDVFDGEHDATYAQRVRGYVFRLSADRRRNVGLHQLKPAVAVRGPHHGDVDADAVKPDDAVRPTSLDCRLALQLQTKFDKQSDSSCEVGYDIIGSDRNRLVSDLSCFFADTRCRPLTEQIVQSSRHLQIIPCR